MSLYTSKPCPCGYFSDPKHECRCTYPQIHRYRAKISGPLLDRIDIHVEVPTVSYRDLSAPADGETSADIRDRVIAARNIQAGRLSRTKIYCNAQMSSWHIRAHCAVNVDSRSLLETAVDKLGLSARAYNRILKIARTLADLAGEGKIGVDQIAEAIQYRTLDRKSNR